MTTAQLIVVAIKASIFLTVLGFGLEATWEDAVYLFRRPGLLFRSFLSMNVLMVLFAIAIAMIFNPSQAIKVALVAIAMSPVPPILPTKERKVGAKGSYGVGLVVAMALLAVIVIPCWLKVLGVYFGFEVEFGLNAILPIIAISILIPVFLGIVIRRLAPAFAQRAAKPVSLVAMVLLVVSVLPILFTEAPAMWAELGNGVVLLLAAFAVVGIVVGHLLGGPDPDNRSMLALATSARHPGIALAIASLNFPGRKGEVMVVVLFHLLVSAIVAIPYVKWRGKQHAKLAVG
jgi:bile acid:Na+ symporter, BASS family